jgi:tetratricopeptide (TPR) repeat protein
MSEGNAVGRFEFAMSWMTGKDKNIENAKEWIRKALDVIDGEFKADQQDEINKLWKKVDAYAGLNNDEKLELRQEFAQFIYKRDCKYRMEEDVEKMKSFCSYLDHAVIKGNKHSQLSVAKMYYLGKEEDGMGVNERLAFYWFMQSAKQGNEISQFYVGECYRKGDGVEEDTEKAREWYQKAAENGQENAKEALEDYFA